MTRYLLLTLFALLLSPVFTSFAAPLIEPPADCGLCGMNRNHFAFSRAIVTYADGTEIGTCSIQCAVRHQQEHASQQLRQLRVADYETKELLDAGTATWVVGGNRPGVMTSTPKWAFARPEAARAFVSEFGGEIVDFTRVLTLARGEVAADAKAEAEAHGHAHGHDHAGHGSPLSFNPAFGDDIYHTHPAGMWMANYKFMHTNQSGLRAGTTNVPLERVIPVTASHKWAKYKFAEDDEAAGRGYLCASAAVWP